MENMRRNVVCRAAFDIGSGSTKLQCSNCEVFLDATGSVIKTNILDELYGIEIPVQFGADFKCSSDGKLSEDIQLKGISIFSDLLSKARALGAVEFHAIATEVFRKAANGSTYLDKLRALGVPVTILTQEMEAELGFGSVQAVLMLSALPPALCVWDSGGASFQITRLSPSAEAGAPRIESYMGALGSSVSTALLLRDVQNKALAANATPNPVSVQDSEAHLKLIKSTLGPVPDWLQGMERTASCAGTNAMFTLCCTVLSILATDEGKEDSTFVSFDAAQAEHALRACLDQTDEQLQRFAAHANSDGPHLVVPKLALLVAVMQHADIKRVEIVKCVGSCPGLLCDSRHWATP